MSNELVERESSLPAEAALNRAPAVLLDEAQLAAKALQGVIKGKENPVIFNGQQYLEFEDWQTVGKFYGYSVKTGEAQPIEVSGVNGAKATAVLLDREGRVVGGAESYCLRDEPNWAKKPWFQLASMAQTRAGAKALRNTLSWVVVLAGYKTTPAEEMESVIRAEVVRENGGGDSPAISEAQAKRWYAIAKTNGFDDTTLKDLLKKYGYGSSKEIKRSDYNSLIEAVGGKNESK